MSAQAVFTCEYEVKHFGTVYVPCGKRVSVPLHQEYYYWFDSPEGWYIDIDGGGKGIVRCPGHKGLL